MLSRAQFVFLCFFFCHCTLNAQISFAPYQVIPTGSFPQVVAIGDLNNDGINDVVLGTGIYFDPTNDCKLFVYYQNSSGTLNPAIKYSYPYSSTTILGLSIADVNNDLLNDIVFCFSDSIGIYFQNASHTFDPLVTYFTGGYPEGLKVGDLNNDGLIDIVVVHQSEFYIKVFYQTSTGFTTTAYAKPFTFDADLKIGDINNDQLNDVVFINRDFPSSMYIFTQNISGNLNPIQTYPFLGVGLKYWSFAIGDLNYDGLNDIAIGVGSNGTAAGIYLYTQDSVTGLLHTPDTLLALNYPNPMEISDLECNGTNEIITETSGTLMNIYEPNALSHQYGQYSSFVVPSTISYRMPDIAVGDINNDGSKDIVIANYAFGLVYLINQASLNAPLIITDTLAFENKIFVDTITRSSYFEIKNNLDNNPGCSIVEQKKYRIDERIELDSLEFDSTFIGIKTICGVSKADTIFKQNLFLDSNLISIDTVLFSSTIDTLFNSSGDDFKLCNILKLYPLPTNKNITLDLDDPCFNYYGDKLLRIEIYDLDAKLIHNSTFDTKQLPVKIDMSNYANGLYCLRASINRDFCIKKVIKEK